MGLLPGIEFSADLLHTQYRVFRNVLQLVCRRCIKQRQKRLSIINVDELLSNF